MSGRGKQRFLWTVFLPGLAGWVGGYCIYSNEAASDHNPPVPLLERIARSADRAPATAGEDTEDPALREKVAALEKRLQEKHVKDRRKKEEWRRSGSEVVVPEDPGPEPSPEEELRLLFETRPYLALRLVERLTAWSGKEQWQPLSLRDFSPEALPEIRAWIGRMPRGKGRLAAVSSVFEQWQQLDPAGAAEAVRSCEGERDAAAVRDLREKFVTGLPGGERIAFLRSLPEASLVEFWTKAATSGYSYFDKQRAWMWSDPAQTAAEMARALENNSFTRQMAMGRWFIQWSANDPVAALAGAQTALPDDAQRLAAGRSAMSSWAEDEPRKAAQHLRTMPAGAARDGAAEAMATVMLRRDDGSDSTEWLSLIDPARRQAAQERLDAEFGTSRADHANPPP